MSDADFYRNLPSISAFADVANIEVYERVGPGWHVIITDVRGSTKAIDAGRYKEVNMLGAASIVSALNAASARDLPYAFGGDGATMLVHESELEPVVESQVRLARMGADLFGMELRVGVVPIAVLDDVGKEVRVCKYALTPDLDLAMFSGDGLSHAEALVKGKDTEATYVRPLPDDVPYADVTGLNCRWEPIRTRHGAMITLLVMARADTEDAKAAVYRNILGALDELLDVDEARPAHQTTTVLAKDAASFTAEARMATGQKSGLGFELHKRQIQAKTRIAQHSMNSGKPIAGFDGPTYRDSVVAHTDFRKFDDTLRMVLDLSLTQHEQLRTTLEERRVAGEVFYGTHAADSALMTCLVFDLDKDHVHFIDGSDGGYAVAAKELKAQIKAARE